VCLLMLERMHRQVTSLDVTLQRRHLLHVAYTTGHYLEHALVTHPEQVATRRLLHRISMEIARRVDHPWPAPTVPASLLFAEFRQAVAEERGYLRFRNRCPLHGRDVEWWRARVRQEHLEDAWHRAVLHSRERRRIRRARQQFRRGGATAPAA
jgi:hypothetical protein